MVNIVGKKNPEQAAPIKYTAVHHQVFMFKYLKLKKKKILKF